MIEVYVFFVAFIAGVLVGTTALNIYELHCRRKAWRMLTLGLDDFDIKCINEEYARRKMVSNEKLEAEQKHDGD